MTMNSHQRIRISLLLVTLQFLFLAYPGVFRLFWSNPVYHFRAATVMLFLLATLLLYFWNGIEMNFPQTKTSCLQHSFWYILCGAVTLHALYLFTAFITAAPIDPRQADMLPQIHAGLETLFRGENPYRAYHDIAPWEIRFVYGPGLWAPFIIPFRLGVDLRYMSILGGTLVPVVMMIYAVRLAKHKQHEIPLLLISCAFVMLYNHAFRMFIPIAHSTTYWYLMLLFCYGFYAQKPYLCTALLGMLLLSRTTMIATVPVYAVFLWKHHRPSIPRHALLLTLTVLLPMLPFLLWDVQSLYHNMVLNYTSIIKHSLWNNQTGFHQTLGITPVMVFYQLGPWVSTVQVFLLLSFYLAVGFKAQRLEHYLSSMGYALFLFCLTTIWPVFYIFLDVFVWWVCIILAWIAIHSGTHRSFAKALAVSVTGIVLILFGIGVWL